MQRTPDLYEQLTELLKDLDHLTGIGLNEWKFRWYRQNEYEDFSGEMLRKLVPADAKSYTESVENFNKMQAENKRLKDDIHRIRKLSGLED
jgi:hypothetical protein